MQNANAPDVIEKAIAIVAAASREQTGGKWLENLTVNAGPHIKEWDITQCWSWSEWPEREAHFPGTTNQDVGIDCVAARRDGEHIAIQCKSRQLDEYGHGNPITKEEFDSFASASAGDFWAERWIVTNGDNPLGNNVQQTLAMASKPVKMVIIGNDLLQQQAAFTHEECPHCEPNPDGEERRQTKTCMQTEAIAESVRILRDHEQSESGGLPVGQARGKIILPCGTGKTRISLRIIEELTSPGELSIVLCPSIALVAQIRREYLQHAVKDIRPLAVCSDETAGYDPKKESSRNTAADPTLDNSNVSANEVKGKVTTVPAEISQWIHDGQGTHQVSVIFGTYQSGSRIAEALKETGVTANVLVADEAHRTAGLRRKRKAKNGTLSEEEQRIRDFTLCHDNEAFPANYRVYQTATPRIYDTSRVNQDQASDWLVRTMDDETVFGVDLYRKSYVESVKNGWLSDYRIIAVGVNGPDAYRIANTLAGETASKGRNPLTSTHFLRGLAFSLAMGGATQHQEERNTSHQVLHRLHEHRRQVKEHGRRPPDRRCEEMAPGLAGREPKWADCRRLQTGALGRHQQRDRPGNRQAEACGSNRANPPRHHQRGNLRRRHRLAVVERRGLPGSPQKPHRRCSGRGTGDAHRAGQREGLHHLPHRDPAQRRPGAMAQHQQQGGRMAGTGPDTPGPPGPRPAY